MPKIKNKAYREFIDSGVINTIDDGIIRKALHNITGKHRLEGRALLICLYYTGARPAEVLKMVARDITKQGGYVVIRVQAAKRGLSRLIYIQYKYGLIRELYAYAISLYPDQLLFYNYKGDYKRLRKTKKGSIVEYVSHTEKLKYHVEKWFNGVIEGSITPYFLRHNRFSKMAEMGASDNEIRLIKGAKRMDSISHYIHLSKKTAKSAARRIN